jgi:hypothetical protein
MRAVSKLSTAAFGRAGLLRGLPPGRALTRICGFGVACGALLAVAAALSPARCDEGMWLPQELSDQVIAEMRDRGCALTKDGIWNTAGTGVANAIVHMGATGSFVSPDGLILTNHHVAFGSVQRISTPEKNYIEHGFLARTRADEVPALGYEAYVMLSSEDVTGRILSGLSASMSPLERHLAIEKTIKRIVKEAEAQGKAGGSDVDCQVSSFYGGARYLLYTSLKLRDVRVVYVPSRAIGEYGGEVDNWMWPRHAGDFSFLRAYVGSDGKPADYSEANVPYRPARYLKIAPQGLEDGDFAFILGFPRTTHRYLTSYAIADYQNSDFPQEIRLLEEEARILEERSRADAGAAVKVAARLKGIDNYLKKDRGVLQGFDEIRLLGRQQEKEQGPVWQAKYGTLLNAFRDLYQEHARHARKDLILENLSDEGLLGQAMLLYKWSNEKLKDDLDRDADFMDRRIPDMRRDLDLFQRGYDPASDRAILKMLLRETASLPGDQRIRTLDSVFGAAADDSLRLEGYLDSLYANTRLADDSLRQAMFDLSRKDLLSQGDAFIGLAAALFEENEQRLTRQKSFDGSLEILTPNWIAAMTEQAGHAVYPDANSTMRLNSGVVRGYSPRDAVWYAPFTTLRGVVEKNTGETPFKCPESLIALAAEKRYGPYADSTLADVPVDLLTTNDSTNGNSGSPLLNARGELVGCLFDGNYEALSGDFAYHETLHRSIHVDIRYVLWVAEYVDGATGVIEELGMKGIR